MIPLLKQQRIDAEENWRLERYGEPPVNPFAELRTNAKLTLGELATYSRIDRRALQRTEFGLYTNPLPSLLDFWSNKGISYPAMLTDYEDFQLLTRQRNFRYFGNINKFPLDHTIHPFRVQRATRISPVDLKPAPVGLIEACKVLCIPLDTLQYWEKKYSMQQSVPKVVLASLNQMGYPVDELTKFKARYAEWRTNRLASQFSQLDWAKEVTTDGR